MTIVSGSTTFYRGMSDVATERHELVVTLPLYKGETVFKGQVLKYIPGTNQETSPTAGTEEKGDTNGVVRAFTDSDNYTSQSGIAGVCLEDVDDSDTTAQKYGERVVSVLLKGITLMRCIVNATGTADGYEKPIGYGALAAIGGGAGGGTIPGSNTVSGFTTATAGAFVHNPAATCTDGGSNTVIGWFMDFQDGHASSQTVSDGTVTASAGQLDDSYDSWVRVYVDIPSAFAGTMVAWA